MAATSAVAAAAPAAATGASPRAAQPSTEEFIVRPLRLIDIHALAECSAQAYWGNPATHYLAPRANLYRGDFLRAFSQGIHRRFLDPQNISIVACTVSDPAVPLGYGQFLRVGDDAGSQTYIRERGIWTRVWIFVLSWVFWMYHRLVNYVWPNRCWDAVAMQNFGSWAAQDSEIHWDSHPERKNRWQAQSILVNPRYQGKGIGRLLMADAIGRSQRERVIMGLSASPQGENLYRKLGFEMLGNFSHRIGEEEGGGIMIWYPEGVDATHVTNQKHSVVA